MAVTTRTGTASGVMFIAALVLSWTVITAGVAAAVWSERDATPLRLGTWGSLWLFTVLMPTLNALTIHRSLRELAGQGSARQPPLEQLARLRPLLLLSANMAVLSALALIFGR